MLTYYRCLNQKFETATREEANQGGLVWIDLFNLTLEEENEVETLLGIDIPTREEMHEIEVSNRFYREAGALYATATIIYNAESKEPETHAITFVLTDKVIVTVRYTDPLPFRTFIARVERISPPLSDPRMVMVELLEAIVSRLADILEITGHGLDAVTHEVFFQENDNNVRKARLELDKMLRRIGQHGDVLSKTRESLASITRMVNFLSQQADYFPSDCECIERFRLIMRDIPPLGDHASFLSSRVAFLLDATLGLINIEQAGIIKIFSVAAVVFLPPTLVASIYGMNFQFMPELNWHLGYPLALLLMALSAWLPYKFFQRKGWL